jgi:glycosyltransferase involved in cell wall biosynthesis
MQHQAKVSIGMPVYNGARYVQDALNSLLSQTFRDFELVISDNASTDETQAICEGYAKRDPRIRYVRQHENMGALANFNFVLNEAKNDLFMWAAHDDRWHPDFLKKLILVLENDPGCALAFSNYIVRNLDTGVETFHKVKDSDSLSPVRNYLSRIIRMSPSMIYGVYRKSMMDGRILSQPFDYADVHFISELATRQRIKVVNDFLYIAGTKGERQPYSVSHSKIHRSAFLERQRQLIFSRFSFPTACFLFFVVCSIMFYSKIRLWRY